MTSPRFMIEMKDTSTRSFPDYATAEAFVKANLAQVNRFYEEKIVSQFGGYVVWTEARNFKPENL